MASPPPDAAAMEAAMAALHRFNVEAFTLLAIALIVTGLRTWARINTVGFKNLWADDYLVLVAAAFYSLETGLAYMVGNTAHGLANNSMTDEQRADLSPSSSEYHTRVLGSKIQLGGWTSYSVLLWCLKGAMCTFFYRLTREIGGYRPRILFGFAFIIGSWLVVTLNLLLSCRPLHLMWQINPNPGEYCTPATSPALIWTYLAFNVATDLYLIAIPIPMLWKAAMPLPQRLWLTALFSCGLFVTACAILRVVLLVSDPVNGAQLAGSWAVRETFVAVITTNLPICFPHVKRFVNPFIGFVSSHMTSSNKRSRSDGESSHYPRGSGTLETWRSKAQQQRTSLPLGSHPASESSSAERMYALEEMENLRIKAAMEEHDEDHGTTLERSNRSMSTVDEEDGIQKHMEVEVMSVTTESGPGNYTSTWTGDRARTPNKTEYFGDKA